VWGMWSGEGGKLMPVPAASKGQVRERADQLLPLSGASSTGTGSSYKSPKRNASVPHRRQRYAVWQTKTALRARSRYHKLAALVSVHSWLELPVPPFNCLAGPLHGASEGLPLICTATSHRHHHCHHFPSLLTSVPALPDR
jgi:hypothetical protein